eukprot:TRINITY_DN10191_c0_g1_i9.p1 TRINITY_DN10191_c0_g1~~TRINITY_DN10191_c0_g1_i9.p1  ORF type:complete len:486 (+),score=89.87 TRINITY_DN10191_c0_g1_i9:73-1530(+)
MCIRDRYYCIYLNMQKSLEPNCKKHAGQKQRKFCKSTECWTRVCPKCAGEEHKEHDVIEYSNLLQEAKNAKEVLIQAKKGDLMSIRRISESTSAFKAQLHEIQLRRREEARLAIINITARINKVADETGQRFEELLNNVLNLEDALENSYHTQMQEVSKIPKLADAVISMGTTDDLRTFFEMCQEGSETNAEVLEYKQAADGIRQNIEELAMTDPLSFVFGFDKSIYERAEEKEAGEIKKHARVRSAIEQSGMKGSRNLQVKLVTDKSIIKPSISSTRNSKANLYNAKTINSKQLTKTSKAVAVKAAARKANVDLKSNLSPKYKARGLKALESPKAIAQCKKSSRSNLMHTSNLSANIKKPHHSNMDGNNSSMRASRLLHANLVDKLENMRALAGEVGEQLRDVAVVFNRDLETVTHVPYTITRVLKFLNCSKVRPANKGSTQISETKICMQEFAKNILDAMFKGKANEKQALCSFIFTPNRCSI